MKPTVRTSIVNLVIVITGLSFLCTTRSAVAQQNPTAFEKAISKDVVAVSSVNLTQVDLTKLNNWALELGLFSEEEAGILKLQLRLAQGAIKSLTDSGVERISVLFRLSDFGAYSPLWVATVKKEGDVAEATEALKATLDIFQLDKRALKVRDRLIFGGPSQTEIDSLFAENAAAERDLSAAIKMMNQHTAGVFFFGNQETRRVVREMLPDLPKPFTEATRELIADHTDWGGLFLDLPPAADLKLIIQASDKESAQTIGRLSTATVEYALRKIQATDDSTDKTFFENFAKGISNNSSEITDRQVVIDAQSMMTDQAFLKSVVAMFRVQKERE